MATRQRLTIPPGEIAVHEIAMVADQILVVTWVDPINAFELVNHGAQSAWFTTDGRMPTVRGGHCRVALAYSSTVVNQLRRAPWRVCLLAERPTTVSLIAA